jgi:hypothetical protein
MEVMARRLSFGLVPLAGENESVSEQYRSRVTVMRQFCNEHMTRAAGFDVHL